MVSVFFTKLFSENKNGMRAYRMARVFSQKYFVKKTFVIRANFSVRVIFSQRYFVKK